VSVDDSNILASTDAASISRRTLWKLCAAPNGLATIVLCYCLPTCRYLSGEASPDWTTVLNATGGADNFYTDLRSIKGSDMEVVVPTTGGSMRPAYPANVSLTADAAV